MFGDSLFTISMLHTNQIMRGGFPKYGADASVFALTYREVFGIDFRQHRLPDKSQRPKPVIRKKSDEASLHLPSWELTYLTYPLLKALLKIMFLFPRWDMLVPWRIE